MAQPHGDAAAYWVPAFAGMTLGDTRPCHSPRNDASDATPSLGNAPPRLQIEAALLHLVADLALGVHRDFAAPGIAHLHGLGGQLRHGDDEFLPDRRAVEIGEALH